MYFDANNLINNIVKNKDKNKIFKIYYDDKIKQVFNEFHVIKPETYNFFGNIKEFINQQNLSNFFASHSDSKSEIIKYIIEFMIELTKSVIKGYNNNYFWISIRLSIPNEDFIIPRWHMDGMFFPTEEKYNSKFIIVPKGDGTICVKSSLQLKENYKNIIKPTPDDYKNNTEYVSQYRNTVNKLFRNKKVYQLNNEQGLMFLSGNIQKALVHSEPNITKERVFISILTGTESQIMDLKKRWNL
jgi:hypothetical protein